jgi:MFS family permease
MTTPVRTAPSDAEQGYALALRRLLPLLFGCYIAAYLDRVNVGFAKLQMAQGLAWSDAVFGFGAGIFFLGYFLFEVPSNLLLERVGARRWIARIMISWGAVSAAFAVVDRLPWGPLPEWFGLEPAVFGFYLLRFLLGVAEAGFFPGMILYLTYWFPGARRTRVVALCMTAIAVANVAGAPLSGAIMQGLDGAAGWSGWRWLFVLEAAPSVLMGSSSCGSCRMGPPTRRGSPPRSAPQSPRRWTPTTPPPARGRPTARWTRCAAGACGRWHWCTSPPRCRCTASTSGCPPSSRRWESPPPTTSRWDSCR